MHQLLTQYVPKTVVPKIFQWPIRQRFLVSSFCGIEKDDELPLEGRRKVCDIIRANDVEFSEYSFERFASWQFVVGKDQRGCGYVGSLTKRLRKYLHVHQLGSLSDDTWGEIGSIIGEYQNAKIWADFTDRFDWQDGEFADGGSCFMSRSGCRHWMRGKLEEHGCHAVRFYRSDDDGAGMGRAILVPHDGKCFVVNAYGLSLLKVARIVSLIVGQSYRRVRVENNRDDTGDFYLNNEGDSYVITSNIDDYDEDGTTRIDFELDCSNDRRCDGCDCRLDPEDHIEIEDNRYCRDCVSYCEDCDEYTTEDTCTVHDSRGHERTVCNVCAGDNYHECPCCNQMIAD